MIAVTVLYFNNPMTVCCDSKCEKAFGINGRPKKQLSDDEDDYCYLTDDEVGEAPNDPGTYEGGHAKPRSPQQRMNKWCVRECERSEKGEMNEVISPRDFSKRFYNQPWKHSED